MQAQYKLQFILKIVMCVFKEKKGCRRYLEGIVFMVSVHCKQNPPNCPALLTSAISFSKLSTTKHEV